MAVLIVLLRSPLYIYINYVGAGHTKMLSNLAYLLFGTLSDCNAFNKPHLVFLSGYYSLVSLLLDHLMF